jgi:uncharacterized protein RhaS with RHS repeats
VNPPVRICASTGTGRRAIHRCPGRPARGPGWRHCPWRRNDYHAAVVHRYYDPATEQFLSVDPLADVTGTPYAFTGGDPVNGSDPTGLYFGRAVNESGCEYTQGCTMGIPDPHIQTGCHGLSSCFSAGWNSMSTAAKIQDATLPITLPLSVCGVGEGVDAAEASAEGSTTLFRAVQPGELADIQETGTYRVAEGTGPGKYFSPTQEQAQAFAKSMPGGPYTITSGDFPASALAKADTIHLFGEGTAYFIPTEVFPFGPVSFP